MSEDSVFKPMSWWVDWASQKLPEFRELSSCHVEDKLETLSQKIYYRLCDFARENQLNDELFIPDMVPRGGEYQPVVVGGSFPLLDKYKEYSLEAFSPFIPPNNREFFCKWIPFNLEYSLMNRVVNFDKSNSSIIEENKTLIVWRTINIVPNNTEDIPQGLFLVLL